MIPVVWEHLQFKAKEFLVLLPILVLLLLLCKVLKHKAAWVKDATLCLNLFAVLLLSFSGLGLLISVVEQSRTLVLVLIAIRN